MHAQTVLQLYRQSIDAGCNEPALAQIRAAYDLARQLFVGCYRPSEKAFCSHLVGTASALLRWGERSEMVVAGLLHSAYLYGEFGDRSRGLSAEKRQAVIQRVGKPAEALIEQYSTTTLESSFCRQDRLVADGGRRDVVVLKLADLLDECVDAGPLYSPDKQLEAGLPHDPAARNDVLELAEELIGEVARADFSRVFREIDACRIPRALTSPLQSFSTIEPGLPEFRISNTWWRMRRLPNRVYAR